MMRRLQCVLLIGLPLFYVPWQSVIAETIVKSGSQTLSFSLRVPTKECTGSTVEGALVPGTGGTDTKAQWHVTVPKGNHIFTVETVYPIPDPLPQYAATVKERRCWTEPSKEGFDVYGYADCGDRVQDGANIGKKLFLGCGGTYNDWWIGNP